MVCKFKVLYSQDDWLFVKKHNQHLVYIFLIHSVWWEQGTPPSPPPIFQNFMLRNYTFFTFKEFHCHLFLCTLIFALWNILCLETTLFLPSKDSTAISFLCSLIFALWNIFCKYNFILEKVNDKNDLFKMTMIIQLHRRLYHLELFSLWTTKSLVSSCFNL